MADSFFSSFANMTGDVFGHHSSLQPKAEFSSIALAYKADGAPVLRTPLSHVVICVPTSLKIYYNKLTKCQTFIGYYFQPEQDQFCVSHLVYGAG